MKERVDEEIVRYLWWLRPVLGEGPEPARPVRRQKPPLILSGSVEEPQLLLFGIDLDLHRRAAKNRLRIAPHSCASTPPWICT